MNGNNPFSDLIPQDQSRTENPFSDLIPDSPVSTFGKGTLQRIEEHRREAPTPELAASKSRGDFIEGLKNLPAEAKNFALNVYRAEKDPVRAIRSVARRIPGIPQYYWENPDVLATDVAASVMPVTRAGEAAEAGSIPSRLQALGREVPRPTPSPVEQATRMKAEAGSGIQAAKESGVELPRGEAIEALEQIKKDTESEYNPDLHRGMSSFFKRFERDLPEPPPGAQSIEDFPVKLPGMKASKISDIPEPTRSKLKAAYRLETLESKPLPGPEPGMSVKKLHNLRQSLNDASASEWPQEVMAASKAKNTLDSIIENKMDQGQWGRDMRRYAIGSTVQEIANVAKRSEYRHTQLSAQAKEAALNTEFRNWARPKPDGSPNARMKMLRKLNPEAADAMERFATGKDPFRNILRRLGTASPTNVLSFSLDHIAAHMINLFLHTHLSPFAIMGVGFGSKYLAGKIAGESIEAIEKMLLDTEKMEDVEGLLGTPATQALAKSPDGREAMNRWLKKRTPATVRGLAIATARAANMPQLIPRIESEINGLEQTSD